MSRGWQKRERARKRERERGREGGREGERERERDVWKFTEALTLSQFQEDMYKGTHIRTCIRTHIRTCIRIHKRTYTRARI